METREITLTQGFVAIVDEEDYDRVVSVGSWHVSIRPTNIYAEHSYRIDGRDKHHRLHRFILDAPPEWEVDHKNGDGLLCTRENLRLVTHRQNAMNRGKYAVGVSFHKATMKWRAYIFDGRKQIGLGNFDDRDEAVAARIEGVKKYFGDFAHRTLVNDER